MLHVIGIKLEDEDAHETFTEVQGVVDEVNKNPNNELNEDKKCQWFIVSLMRLVQNNI